MSGRGQVRTYVCIWYLAKAVLGLSITLGHTGKGNGAWCRGVQTPSDEAELAPLEPVRLQLEDRWLPVNHLRGEHFPVISLFIL